MSEQMYNVGKIVNTHGIKGELKVISQTDFPEERFAKGSSLIMIDPAQKMKLNVEVEASRLHKNTIIVKLVGYDNINDVEKYKGWMLKVSSERLLDLGEGEFYFHEIIGCRVVTDEGLELGTVQEIISTGANDVWVIQPEKGKQLLIPYIDDVVLQVNIEQKEIKIHVLEGLLDL
ncbi:MAG: ribosome maturation factor RimM [Paenibacillus sp. RIFOXYA1_FULL_44_5]|nr:MAG: ribosome maturation factor RimM [Paenibacillus sp. RIFOXYA1_FULL_44_5]